ncbi:MAG: three-Cys-motif partner protein TcmP [Deltaproteobacteria bacterium]|nr:three-Cys-motif partner protein TcmP [Deltaproteobacteria bacterium]MBW2571428.1 three-Cys-motif partner protein TcmP [Deltaproteobacteria bacterium]MBW2668864.1 three-Cys-motif partner protein TcmP [Deltaproteobacteria bacterium]
MKNQLQTLDDGLLTPEVGRWSEKKYSLIHNYAEMFATGMKHKWDCRVYIDLFAGAGKAKIRDSNRIVYASPLLALNVRDRFDRYIFCEFDPDIMDALSQRVRKDHGDVDVKFVQGDVNLKVDEVIKSIPKHSGRFKVLSFCVVDPFKLSSLDFATIKSLSDFYMDFLVLIACGMDAQRNEKIYLSQNNTVVECFLGDPCWRDNLPDAKWKRISFSDYLVDCFSQEMAKLDYKSVDLMDTVLIRQPNKAPLYRLAFYSRSDLGTKFWNQTKKYSDPQRKFDFTWKA